MKNENSEGVVHPKFHEDGFPSGKVARSEKMASNCGAPPNTEEEREIEISEGDHRKNVGKVEGVEGGFGDRKFLNAPCE